MPKTGIFYVRFGSIVNTRANSDNVLFQTNSEQASDERTQYLKEYQLLVAKSAELRIKTGERVPIYSRTTDHKWYLTKDKYGMLYLFMVHSKVEEHIVYKLQTKVQGVIDRYYDDIVDHNEPALKRMAELIEFHITQFNNALHNNPQASIIMESEESNKEIVEVEGIKVNLEKFDADAVSVDQSNIFTKIENRQKRLMWIQLSVIFSSLMVFGLGALDLMANLSATAGGK